jgi:hypothetical protein
MAAAPEPLSRIRGIWDNEARSDWGLSARSKPLVLGPQAARSMLIAGQSRYSLFAPVPALLSVPWVNVDYRNTNFIENEGHPPFSMLARLTVGLES